jgi:hypothetical protein
MDSALSRVQAPADCLERPSGQDPSHFEMPELDSPPYSDLNAKPSRGSVFCQPCVMGAPARAQRSGNSNRGSQNSYLTPAENPLPYGCG